MPWPGRDAEVRAETTSVWAWMVSPGMTGLGKAISSNPRLATVVPSVVSKTESPMSSERVKRLLTRRVPNSVDRANSSSRCSGWAFMVSTEKSVLSASVMVRVTAWSMTRPGVRSSNHLPMTGRSALSTAGGSVLAEEEVGNGLARGEHVRGARHHVAGVGDEGDPVDGGRRVAAQEHEGVGLLERCGRLDADL